MAYVNMREMLCGARQGRYAVGAFNIVDAATTLAVVQAAENQRAPVIIQTSVKTVKLYGAEPLAGMICAAAKASSVPVALHLDHCKQEEVIRECLDAGWSSVMFDGSALSFEENLATTRRVVELARPRDVTVEGELGAIVGVEDDIFVSRQDAHLADPDQALRFVEATEVDCFAPAIGTAHGVYKGEPKIAYDRLGTISQTCDVPIAIHGGTGLSDEAFRRCIELGGAKVNVSTQIKHSFRDSLEQFFKDQPQQYEPVKSIGYVREQVREIVEGFIERFGSAGKA
jgi:fructose-bisphosphate aldolase class II